MLRPLLNWRTLLAFIAILIVSGTIWYSSYLADKIKKDEQHKVELWIEAGKFINNPEHGAGTDLTLASMVLIQKDIPIILTDEKDNISEWVNLDSAKVERGWKQKDNRDPNQNTYLKNKLEDFQRSPIEWVHPFDSTKRNRYYYGESRLLQEVKYYPLVQLLIVSLFILITIQAIRSSYRSTQNQVWAGMAKETAHQMGTPVSSLEGWMEILKESHREEQFVGEMEKDVRRLRLVSDRFGKIGSTPQLESRDIAAQVENMVEYMRKRAGGRVRFATTVIGERPVLASISAPLFDWVIENLLKNALDAMEGRGDIRVVISNQDHDVVVDVTDSGKGISKQNSNRIFMPGFTTKKRGWGLGLSLSKRIIEQYHKGSLHVKWSEPGKGTTFRIVLKK